MHLADLIRLSLTSSEDLWISYERIAKHYLAKIEWRLFLLALPLPLLFFSLMAFGESFSWKALIKANVFGIGFLGFLAVVFVVSAAFLESILRRTETSASFEEVSHIIWFSGAPLLAALPLFIIPILALPVYAILFLRFLQTLYSGLIRVFFLSRDTAFRTTMTLLAALSVAGAGFLLFIILVFTFVF